MKKTESDSVLFPLTSAQMRRLPMSKETAEALFALRQLTTVVYGTIYEHVCDDFGNPYEKEKLVTLNEATDTLKTMLKDILVDECLYDTMGSIHMRCV